MKYALILSGRIVEYRDLPAHVACKHVDGLPILRPVEEAAAPAYDPDQQRLVESVTILDDRVVVAYEAVSLTADEVISNLDRALMQMLNAGAAERRYDSIHTAALRAGFAGPFQAEGLAFATWMDACNATAYQIMTAVQAGTRPIPSRAEFIAEMPVLVLP